MNWDFLSAHASLLIALCAAAAMLLTVAIGFRRIKPLLTTRNLAFSAAVAALYAAVTLLTIPISFGQVQVRVAEALTILPALTPMALPGLFVGCLISNLVAGVSVLDMVFGPLATALAAILTRALRKNIHLAALPPVVVNAVVVGVILHTAYGVPLAPAMGSVGLGQAIACYGLGLPLWWALKKLPGDLLRRDEL